MASQEFEIERSKIGLFYLEYLKTHTFIKNKTIILYFLKEKYPDMYFQKTYTHELLHVLTHQFRQFCRLALKFDVIYTTGSYSGRLYQIKNRKKLSKLEKKLNKLKNSIITIKVG